MKLLWHAPINKIYDRCLDSGWGIDLLYEIDGNGDYWILSKDGSRNVDLPLKLYEIDETLPANSLIIARLLADHNKKDADGDERFIVAVVDEVPTLQEKQDWAEYIEEIDI